MIDVPTESAPPETLMFACPRFTPHTSKGLTEGVVDPAGKNSMIEVRPSSKVKTVGSPVVNVRYTP
jgi:hypothetical protein